MIDINKKHRTRDGREARIYATDGGTKNCVHGAVRDGETWRLSSWGQDGVKFGCEGLHDLIEVKPRIQRTVWLNVYEDNTYGPYSTKSNAARLSRYGRLACVKVEIDCEEGEGL